MKNPVIAVTTGLAMMFALASTSFLSGQEPAHDHGAQPTAKELSQARYRFSPELEKIKSLAGRWEGTTFRKSEGTNPAVMTYSVTGAGSAVVETMFPGAKNEMTTVYHDDSSGHLVAEHYCTAANQPKLRLIESKDGRLNFELSPESDLRADIEGHAHKLAITFGADGTIVHDWLNFYMGNPAEQRNITLKRAN